jgi:hypothetical protein
MNYGTYMGASKTGTGKAIPVTPTGQIDINALIQNMVDRRKKYFYDTIKFPPGLAVSNTPYGYFTTALNQPDQYNGNIPKTMLETNLTPPAGQFNPPYDLIINNLGFLFNSDVAGYDLTQFLKLCWFEFKILEKVQWNGGLVRHPPGAGVSGATSKTSEAFWNNGIPEPGSIWWFGDYKKYIPPLVNFTLTLNFPETLNTFYNSVLPANVLAEGTAGTALPTLAATKNGGNGIQLQAWMNGLSDGPVS